MLAITPACGASEAEPNGEGALSAFAFAREVGRRRRGIEDAVFLFEIAPVDDADHAPAALLAAMTRPGTG